MTDPFGKILRRNTRRTSINKKESIHKKQHALEQLKSKNYPPSQSEESHHRVDSVLESSLREIIGSKNFALFNLSLNFCETTIYNKVFLENLVAVH